MPLAETRLYPVTYQSKDHGLLLHGYADTIIYTSPPGNASHILIGIRLGGDPAKTQALSTVLRAGEPFSIVVNGEELTCCGAGQKYTLKHGTLAPYAEALLAAQDTVIKEKEQIPGKEGLRSFVKSRTCYLYCAAGDHESLFRQIQRQTSAPMLPEFRDYVIPEARRRGILTRLEVHSTTEAFEAWQLSLDRDERNLIALLNEGLKRGAIRIPGATNGSRDTFKQIQTIPQYLNAFGTQIAQKIKSRFVPLFDPEKEIISETVRQCDANVLAHTGYRLYDAQLAVVESVKRKIDRNLPAIIVAECGSGKSKMGSAALAASQMEEGGKHFNVLLCPSHMTQKWVREIEETVPNARAAVVRTVPELRRVYNDYQRKNTNVYAIISKESARDGYVRYPAVIARKLRGQTTFECPSCGATLEEPFSEGGVTYWVEAQAPFFLRQNSKNHKCHSCGSPLWAPLTSHSIPKDWTMIGGFGYVYLPQLSEYYAKTNKPKIIRQLDELAQWRPGDAVPFPSTAEKYPLSTYIRKQMRGKIDGALFDELHQYNNDSGQGDAMAEIARTAKKVIGMTATLINGYATGIFYLLYRLFPRAMQLDGRDYQGVSAFAKEYGIVQSSYDIEVDVYNQKRSNKIHKRRDKILPGVSPLIYSRFLMESAVFLSLMDIGKDLPEYEEIPIAVRMNPDEQNEYDRIKTYSQSVMRSNPKLSHKIWSALLNLLTVYPDQSYGQPPVYNPDNGEVLFTPKETRIPGDLLKKDHTILSLIHRKIQCGENILIYTSWTRLDTQVKLLKALEKDGVCTELLSANIVPAKRETWLLDKAAQGMRVLITNPQLVETGLDLNMFTTLIYYNVNYNPFTLRQSSRRSWRINQTAPRIEVYFFYYLGTVQERALHLMATKLSVAGIIEGHISDEGLAALSECQDISSQLAKELAQGVQGCVDGLSDIFRRMAILKEPHPVQPQLDITVQTGPGPLSIPTASSLDASQAAPSPMQEGTIAPPYFTVSGPTVNFEFEVFRKKTPKLTAQEAGQISLFDFDAVEIA